MKPQSKATAPDWDHLTLRRGVLRTPEGDVPVQRIGRGAFAEVYRGVADPDRVYALVDDDCYDKEIAEEAARDSKNPHLPAVEVVGATADKKVYAMPYYRTPLRKTDSPRAWEDYKVIKDCYVSRRSGMTGYEKSQSVLDCARERGVSPAVAEALDDLMSTAANYSVEYTAEFSPRNLATDAAGNLVLLDVLFDAEALRKLRKKRTAEGAGQP